MKLKNKVKPAVPPMESGVYMAVCVLVADLGDQYSEMFKKAQRKVVFSFDIPSETVVIDGEQRPRQLSKWFTFSVSKKSTLYKTLNSWLNANMSEQEMSEVDLFELIGRGCQVQVTVSEDGSHNNITNVMALPKGIPAPASDTPPTAYDIDEDDFTSVKWDALPDWVKNAVMKSEQYQQNPPDTSLDMPSEPADQIIHVSPNNSEQSRTETAPIIATNEDFEGCPF